MRQAQNNKNKFSKAVRHRLLDLDLSITDLAAKIGRPRESVSRCIHSKRFPRVRAAVAAALNISQS